MKRIATKLPANEESDRRQYVQVDGVLPERDARQGILSYEPIHSIAESHLGLSG